MKPEQWKKVIENAIGECEEILAKNEARLHEAYLVGERNLKVTVSLAIQSEGAFSASVTPEIGFSLKWGQAGQPSSVTFTQEPLPGMPDATKAGRGKAAAR